MTWASGLQMYGSEEDGSIDEDALSSILKTALGVAELTVTDLFRAIDQEEKEKITFGKWAQLCREVSPGDEQQPQVESLPTGLTRPPCPRGAQTDVLGRRVPPGAWRG